VGRIKNSKTSITIGFSERLNQGSASNQGLYRLFGGVRKRGKTVYTMKLAIKSVSYNSAANTVTIDFAKPFKTAVQMTVEAGIVAANGASSTSAFSAIVN
jgi:Bacterial Ig-like domain